MCGNFFKASSHHYISLRIINAKACNSPIKQACCFTHSCKTKHRKFAHKSPTKGFQHNFFFFFIILLGNKQNNIFNMIFYIIRKLKNLRNYSKALRNKIVLCYRPCHILYNMTGSYFLGLSPFLMRCQK